MELSREERDLHRSNERLTPQSHLFRLQRRIDVCLWERFFKKKMHFPCAIKDTIGKYSLKWWSPVVKAQINLPLPKESTNNQRVCGEWKSSNLKASGESELWHLLLNPSSVLEWVVASSVCGEWREESLPYFLMVQWPPSSMSTPMTVLSYFISLLPSRSWVEML